MLLSYPCVRVAETVKTVRIKVFWTVLVVLKSHELAFSVFLESVSRDASNECVVYILIENIKKTGSVLHQD